MIPMANYVVPDSFLSNIEREKRERDRESWEFLSRCSPTLPCHSHREILFKKNMELKRSFFFLLSLGVRNLWGEGKTPCGIC